MTKYQELTLTTILSTETKKGRVCLYIDNKQIAQWDVDKAREIHRMLGEAIEAAITDEMIFTFFKTKLNLDDNSAIAVLRDFREIRQGDKGITNVN